MIKTWALYTVILGHPVIGTFVMLCGWNYVLETVASGGVGADVANGVRAVHH